METDGCFRADLEKYYRIEFRGQAHSFRRKVRLWVTHLGLHCVAVYRLGRYARARRVRGHFWIAPLCLVGEILAFLVKLIHHVDIFAADIGPAFYIGHVGTIYFGKTRVGENVSVAHNVTIGIGLSDGVQAVPSLGRNVWIGSGSILYGNIRIGDGVTINTGTVLSRSVPDGCLVGGNPGRILAKNYDNSRLFGIIQPGAPVPDTGEEPELEASGEPEKNRSKETLPQG